MNHRILCDLRRRRQAGQTAVIVALTFVVLIAFAGLAIDGGHVYLVNRRAQNATDVAALAAAKQLANAATFLTGPPTSFNDPAVKAAHDLAQSTCGRPSEIVCCATGRAPRCRIASPGACISRGREPCAATACAATTCRSAGVCAAGG